MKRTVRKGKGGIHLLPGKGLEANRKRELSEIKGKLPGTRERKEIRVF